MGDALRSWILGIVGAAMLAAIAMTITPEGRVKKVVSLTCGVAMIIALVRPVTGFDYTGFAKSLTRLRQNAALFSEDASDTNEKLTGLIIEERCAAYILDKGTLLGINDLAVSVSAKWSTEGYWYPSGATITTSANQEFRDKLSYIIEAELGIPPGELIWRMTNEE